MVEKFFELYKEQKKFQEKVTGINYFDLPDDNVQWASYHMLALMEETGELLKSDKRWKTHRNEHYNTENKKEEIADCIITLMNVAMFSGMSSNDILQAVEDKIKQNFEKLKLKKEND